VHHRQTIKFDSYIGDCAKGSVGKLHNSFNNGWPSAYFKTLPDINGKQVKIRMISLSLFIFYFNFIPCYTFPEHKNLLENLFYPLSKPNSKQSADYSTDNDGKTDLKLRIRDAIMQTKTLISSRVVNVTVLLLEFVPTV
jgi:hypothetical protein